MIILILTKNSNCSYCKLEKETLIQSRLFEAQMALNTGKGTSNDPFHRDLHEKTM